jgi:uncharacterized small protein (DUF1192 family)
MAIDPDEVLPRKPKSQIVLGEDISTHSVEELERRIAALEAEIARARDALALREKTRFAAASIFKS